MHIKLIDSILFKGKSIFFYLSKNFFILNLKKSLHKSNKAWIAKNYKKNYLKT